jgi:hypothetical protein
VLWETVIEPAKDDDVVFAARDVDAFFDGRPERGMAPSLAEAVEKRCEHPQSVTLMFELDEAIDEVIRATEEEREWKEELDKRYESNRAMQARVEELLRDQAFVDRLREALEAATYMYALGADLARIGVEGEAYESYIEAVDGLDQIRLQSAEATSDDRALVVVDAQFHATIQMVLDPSLATLLDGEPQITITDFGHGTPIAHAYATLPLSASYEVTIDPERRAVESPLMAGASRATGTE